MIKKLGLLFLIALTGCSIHESNYRSIKKEICFTPDGEGGSISDGIITVTSLKPSSSGKVDKKVYIEPGITWSINKRTVTIKQPNR